MSRLRTLDTSAAGRHGQGRTLPLRVGTRGSPLALWQTRHFLSIISGFCPVLRDEGF
jgi:hydroxymethylbilane synthase